MEDKIKRESSGVYLVRKAQDAGGYEERMLRGICAEALLTPTIVYEEEQRCCSYDITSYVRLEEALQNRRLGYRQMISLVAQLEDILRLLERYMLNEQSVSLKREDLYVTTESTSDADLKLCVLAGGGRAGQELGRQLRELVELLLLHADETDPETSALAMAWLHVIYEDHFGIRDLLQAARIERQQRTRDTAGDPEADGNGSNQMGYLAGVEWNAKDGYSGNMPEGWDRTDLSAAEPIAEAERIRYRLDGSDAEMPEPAPEKQGISEGGFFRKKTKKAEPPESESAWEMERFPDLQKGEAAETEEKTSPWLRMVCALLAATAALSFLYLFRGAGLLRKLLPLYLIFCAGVIIATVLSVILAHARRRSAMRV